MAISFGVAVHQSMLNGVGTFRSALLSTAVFLPLALLTFFALRTLSLEQDALKARNLALVETRLDATASTITALLELAGRDELEQAREIWSSRGPEALRYFVLSGGAGFAMVFRHGQRLFPPVDSDPLLLSKHGGLRAFEDPAAALLSTLDSAGNPNIARLLSLSGGEQTLLRCARSVDEIDICIAVEPEKMSRQVLAALDQAARSAGYDRDTIWLVTPENQRLGVDDLAPRRDTVSRALGGELSEWRIQTVDGFAASSPAGQGVAAFALTGALLAGWAVLMVSIYRTSTEKAHNTERRARVVAMLSHELHTPLANLRLYADLLQRKAGDAEAVSRHARVVEEEIARLEEIAMNAVELSRGAPDVSRLEPGNPDEVLKRLVERLAPLMAAAGCTVSLNTGASMRCLYDRAAWERVLVNLLDNARKYAPGSAINITSTLEGHTLGLTVADQGQGITGPMRDVLFEPLSRDAKSNIPGFGLGLAVVRALARRNGGDAILIDSARGAVFNVTMDVRRQSHCAVGSQS